MMEGEKMFNVNSYVNYIELHWKAFFSVNQLMFSETIAFLVSYLENIAKYLPKK